MEQQEFKKLVVAAIKSFEKQGAKSATADGAWCVYKSPVGCCIVGWMMPNDEIRELADAQENSSIHSLWIDDFPWAAQFLPPQIAFLGELQSIHDQIYSDQDVDIEVNEMKFAACEFFGEDINFDEVL